MSEPAGPLLSRRAALIAGTVATGTAWVAPLATSVSMTTAHAASGAPDSVKGPGSKPGQGSRPKQPNNSDNRPKPPAGNNGRPKPPANNQGGPRQPAYNGGYPKASHRYTDLRASGSSRGGRGYARSARDVGKASESTPWFGRAWAWVRRFF